MWEGLQNSIHFLLILGSRRRASGGFPCTRELDFHFCSRTQKRLQNGSQNGAFWAPKSELYSLWGTMGGEVGSRDETSETRSLLGRSGAGGGASDRIISCRRGGIQGGEGEERDGEEGRRTLSHADTLLRRVGGLSKTPAACHRRPPHTMRFQKKTSNPGLGR